MAAAAAVAAALAATPLFDLEGESWKHLTPDKWAEIFTYLDRAEEGGIKGQKAWVARQLDMPIQTLLDRYKARNGRVSKRGPQPLLVVKGVDWEAKLADHIQWQADMGDPMSLAEVCELGAKLGVAKHVAVGGRSWADGFRQRHKLSLRTPQMLERARTVGLTSVRAKRLYDILQQVYASMPGITPDKVYNMDETGLEAGNIRRGKAVVRKSTRDVACTTAVESRQHITVVVCGNAAGHVITPMILFPRYFRGGKEKEYQAWPDVVVRSDPSPYLTDEAWKQWVNLFLQETGGDCVLILDQHSTRYNLEGLYKLANAGVKLVTLPAHTTHALQPLDVAVFSPFKAFLSAHINSLKLGRNTVTALVRAGLAQALAKTVDPFTGTLTSNLTKGFAKTGIWPLDPLRARGSCARGDRLDAEMEKLAALEADHGDAAAGGAGAAAAGVDLDEEPPADGEDDDASSDSDGESTTPSDAEAADVLAPSPTLLASIAAFLEKRKKKEASPANILTGGMALAAIFEKRKRKEEAAEAVGAKRLEREKRRAEKAAAAAAKAVHTAATKPTKAAATVAKTPRKRRTAAATPAPGPTAAALVPGPAPSAPPAVPTPTTTPAAHPLTTTDMPTTSTTTVTAGSKRKRCATVVAAPAVGGLPKRGKKFHGSHDD